MVTTNRDCSIEYIGSDSIKVISNGQSNIMKQILIAVPNVSDFIGKQVTLSFDSVETSSSSVSDWRLFLYKNNDLTGGGVLGDYIHNDHSLTVTIPSDTVTLDVILRLSQSSSIAANEYCIFHKVQVELGNKVSTYMPYAESNAALTEKLFRIIATGNHTQQAANVWEDTGLTFTLDRDTLVTVSTNWSNGKPLGLLITANYSSDSSQKFYYEANSVTSVVYATPVFKLNSATYHVYAKRDTPLGNNDYTVYAIG